MPFRISLVEFGDGGEVGAGGDVELDVRHADAHGAETGWIGRVDADAVAPRAGRFDRVAGFAEAELGAFQEALGVVETFQQGFQVRQHEGCGAADDFGSAGGQVELAAADVDPHVFEAGHQVGVAGEAEAHEVVGDGLALIGDADVDVAEFDDVAEVFDGAVEGGCGDGGVIHCFGLPVGVGIGGECSPGPARGPYWGLAACGSGVLGWMWGSAQTQSARGHERGGRGPRGLRLTFDLIVPCATLHEFRVMSADSKTKWLARFVRRERIADRSSSEAIARAERRLVDDELGGELITSQIRLDSATRNQKKGATGTVIYSF